MYAFEVTYRIADKRTSDGTARERYDGLIGRLKALPSALRRGHFADEGHVATSSWVVKTTDEKPADLGPKLAKGLTTGVDLLEVMRVRLSDKFELTVEVPKPDPPKR